MLLGNRGNRQTLLSPPPPSLPTSRYECPFTLPPPLQPGGGVPLGTSPLLGCWAPSPLTCSGLGSTVVSQSPFCKCTLMFSSLHLLNALLTQHPSPATGSFTENKTLQKPPIFAVSTFSSQFPILVRTTLVKVTSGQQAAKSKWSVLHPHLAPSATFGHWKLPLGQQLPLAPRQHPLLAFSPLH